MYGELFHAFLKFSNQTVLLKYIFVLNYGILCNYVRFPSFIRIPVSLEYT